MSANTEYTRIKESTISTFFTKLKAAFWPKADVINVSLADVAVTGDYDDLTDKPNLSAKEDTSNKVSSWSVTTSDTKYPSEKLVYDSLAGKLSLAAQVLTSEQQTQARTNIGIVVLTAEEYEQITPDENTLYFIKETTI